LENRVLLAFVLSIAVFVGWGVFLSKVQPPPQKIALDQKMPADSNTQLGQDEPGSAGSGLTASQATAPEPLQPQFAGTEETINVFLGKVTYVLSSQGATIRKVMLNDYLDDTGAPIDLVQGVQGKKWPLSLAANDDEVSRILQNAYYDVSPKSLELSESNPTGQLTMRLRHESGLEVVREFTFHYQQFLIDVKTQITAIPLASRNLQYRVLWGPGLGGYTVSKTDYFAFAGPTTFVNNERMESPSDEVPGEVKFSGDLEWTAFQNKYFAAALIPGKGTKAAVVVNDNDDLYVGLQMESIQSNAILEYKIYAGTKQLQVLEASEHKLVRLMDYGWFGNKFAFLVKPLLRVLQYFYGITNNYGWSIIFLTFIIKLIFSPLTHKSFKSMKGMHKVQPYVKIIQERNKDDRQKMNQEMIDLYKKHKVNPLGGCLPMLLQIPVFIALYHALFFSIELRGAPFILWIQDLSVQDPYYITPVLMGATMFFQQRLSPQMGDPMQQKIMMMLPIFFTFLFITFPAGLVIYWTVNNLLTISQQYYIYKIAKD
jgi:YidC/Oxa1 family membrane protein insertase